MEKGFKRRTIMLELEEVTKKLKKDSIDFSTSTDEFSLKKNKIRREKLLEEFPYLISFLDDTVDKVTIDRSDSEILFVRFDPGLRDNYTLDLECILTETTYLIVDQKLGANLGLQAEV